MKLLTRISSLENGYRFTGFIGGGTTCSLTRSHLVFVTFRIPHCSRYHIVHVERDIIVFDCHPKLTVPGYGGSADFYVEYIIRESTSSNIIQLYSKIKKRFNLISISSPLIQGYRECYILLKLNL
jgi:hypothetical protein